MNFIKAQIKRFFETGKWAMKLIFLVVLVELGLIVGVVATMGNELTDEDGSCLKFLDIGDPRKDKKGFSGADDIADWFRNDKSDDWRQRD